MGEKGTGTDTLRKTIKLRPSTDTNTYDVHSTQENTSVGNGASGFADTQVKNEETNLKINTLLNKITGFSESESKMGNFNPPPNPELIMKKTAPSAEGTIPMPENPLIPKFNKPVGEPSPSGYYKPAEPRTYSNYSQVYPNTITEPRGGGPYYAKMGVGQNPDKFMEKINYMIHLLEAQQHEKTNNITEEFLLYTFLGVFVIYVLDSFARGGKYIR